MRTFLFVLATVAACSGAQRSHTVARRTGTGGRTGDPCNATCAAQFQECKATSTPYEVEFFCASEREHCDDACGGIQIR